MEYLSPTITAWCQVHSCSKKYVWGKKQSTRKIGAHSSHYSYPKNNKKILPCSQFVSDSLTLERRELFCPVTEL